MIRFHLFLPKIKDITNFQAKVFHSDEAYVYGLLDSYEYDDYDRLIQLLDSTCIADGTKNLEKRMEDVKKSIWILSSGKVRQKF